MATTPPVPTIESEIADLQVKTTALGEVNVLARVEALEAKITSHLADYESVKATLRKSYGTQI